jgi:nifR3 family TIM-barrel protein
MKGFWDEMKKPLFVLAPMADVTDVAFRRIIAKYSKVKGGVPYITYTEFVSADGLARAPEEGRKKLMRDLSFTDAERPIVAQFFTSTPLHMEKAAALAQELGFDGVDINMGCPADAVVRQGAGAELIKHPGLAQELIAAAKQGAPNLPVSVKTRLGYNQDTLEEWLPALLKAKPSAVTIHARTRKEMSLVPARWERVARAVEIRNEQGSDACILGNGDLKNVDDAKQKIAESGADGGMLGRAIFGNPWLFSNSSELANIPARLRVAVEHTKLFEETLGDIKNFALMKKHFKAYCEGFPGAKELRMKLMETSNAHEIEDSIEDFLKEGVY